MRKLLTFTAVLLLSATTFARGQVSLSYTNTNFVDTFLNDHTGSYSYILTSRRGTNTKKMRGSGDLADYTTAREQRPLSKVPVPHITVSLKKKAGTLGELHFKETNPVNYEKSVAHEYTLEVTLSAGSWADFDSGKAVSAQLTPKGVEQYKKWLEVYAEEVYGQILATALKKDKKRITEIKATGAEISAGDTFTLSKNRVRASLARAFFRVQVRAR